jgi:RND family efflux transporter MFP subunit
MPQLIRCHGGVVLLCAALIAACGKKDEKAAAPPAKPRAIEVMTLSAKPLRTTGEYLGSLLSRDSVGVLPQVAGYIRKIHVRPGMRVTAGAPLVEIDARDENAALSSASAQAESAVTQRALAEQMLKRAEELYKEGLTTAQEIDQRRADLAATTAAVRAAGAQVSQRQVALSNRTIRAAVPGVVADVNVRLGDYVTPTTPLTSIAQAIALELSVSVPAARARALALDAPVEVLAEDGSLLVESKVSFIAPEADPRTQLVEIKATFDNTMGLRPRELVRARVIYATDVALQVPLLAVQRQASKSFAFVVADKGKGLVVEKRLVDLGPLRQHGYLVKSGLAAGDRVAVSSLMMLKDGAAVTIAPPKEGDKSPPKKADATAAPAAGTAAAATAAKPEQVRSASGAGK